MDQNHIITEDLERIAAEAIDWEKLRGKRVLISGINGLIASYIARMIFHLNDTRDMGITLYGLARSEKKTVRKWGNLLDREDFCMIYQDVTVPLAFDGGIDIMIHAASQTGPQQFAEDPVGTAMGNVLGTYQLLEYGRSHGTGQFLLLSTREIYGKGSLDFVKEDQYGVMDPTSVRSCYPESKRMAENLCVSYRSQYNMDCRIVRIAHTYGPGMILGDGRVVGDFLHNVVERKNIEMNSDGSGTLALTYIGDVIAGIFYTLLNFEEHVYNVSNSRETVTVKELAQTLCELFADYGISLIMNIPKEKPAGYLNYKLGFLLSDKAMAEGWEPKVSLREGLRRTVQYFEEMREE
nr:NAD-dependent epimerase/dehydratase family protein [Lachnospiraceae bacterium]